MQLENVNFPLFFLFFFLSLSFFFKGCTSSRSSLRIFTMIKSGSALVTLALASISISYAQPRVISCKLSCLTYVSRLRMKCHAFLSFRVIATIEKQTKGKFYFQPRSREYNSIYVLRDKLREHVSSANEKMEIDLKIRVPCQFRGFNRVRGNAFQSCKQGNITIIRVFEFAR